jgi:hypothetical protein
MSSWSWRQALKQDPNENDLTEEENLNLFFIGQKKLLENFPENLLKKNLFIHFS